MAGTILLIDDERVMRDGLNFMLSQSGYQVCAVPGGQQGLDRFEEGGIDLVLLDLSLPDMPGIEVLQRLKEADPAARVIILTGFAPNEPILQEAAEIIFKPFRLEELLTVVNRVLDAD
jgi:DNA-binding response OmpR family regulator